MVVGCGKGFGFPLGEFHCSIGGGSFPRLIVVEERALIGSCRQGSFEQGGPFDDNKNSLL